MGSRVGVGGAEKAQRRRRQLQLGRQRASGPVGPGRAVAEGAPSCPLVPVWQRAGPLMGHRRTAGGWHGTCPPALGPMASSLAWCWGWGGGVPPAAAASHTGHSVQRRPQCGAKLHGTRFNRPHATTATAVYCMGRGCHAASCRELLPACLAGKRATDRLNPHPPLQPGMSCSWCGMRILSSSAPGCSGAFSGLTGRGLK